MEEGKMKKLVIFTLAMLLAFSGAALAQPSHHDGGDDAALLNVEDVDVNVATKGAVQATQGGTIDQSKRFDSNDNNSIRDSRSDYNNFQPTNSLNDNSKNLYVVDNNILANVNIAAADKKSHHGGQDGLDPQLAAFPFPQPEEECCPEVSQTNTLTQFKTQSASIAGFNCATGVSNANAAGGNLNAQTAYTTVGVAFVK
jgi:hypothetical protein